ncbi:MAG: UDP-N-acetylmuramoyl-tripeptide--D-alanyl-D-alanine ligase [Spirochaetaceae bacterium]|nr:MAG: UDP-N-acetylmuramoyl-tripeptide--D-alanyl-D-alanine ligase [Spirochaetaceae bacterium]
MTDTVVGKDLLSPEQACRFADGHLAVAGSRNIQGVVVDSRQVEEGLLFVALPGERADGHEFIPQALERGATALLVASNQWSGRQGQLRGLLEGIPTVSVIVVDNTLRGLQNLAKAYLSRFPDLMRIGITGSNGKTTTKEILGSIFALDRPTVISQGNLNSEIGLPLSCFQVRAGHHCSVFELGINHPGEMEVLADIYRPDVAVITNIGTAHIGFLGSREAIAREKKKILHYFDGIQKAFIYEAESFSDLLKDGVQGEVIHFGPRSTRGFEGSEDLGLDGTIIHWEGLRIRFPLFGAHNLRNALASISVSAELGISKENIKQGLEKTRPLVGRSQIFRGPVTIIQDCYNANPDSFRQVFGFVFALPWPGRKIGVLGAMKELGEQSQEAHRQIGTEAGEGDFQGLFLFGEEMEEAFRQIRDRDFKGMVSWTTDFQSLRESLQSYLREGDLLLIKGSRTAELERLMPELVGG